jgi:hypothetical protein
MHPIFFPVLKSLNTRLRVDFSLHQNAEPNAKDMIDSLQMQYSCGRQAPIVKELVDFISDSTSESCINQIPQVILMIAFPFHRAAATSAL